MQALTQTPAWQALLRHQQDIKTLHLRDLFQSDPKRFASYSLQAGDLLLDYSKNRITGQSLKLLMELARSRQVERLRDQMFSGAAINVTEQRPALHCALRNPEHPGLMINGIDIIPGVRKVLEKITLFSNSLRNGDYLGYTGERIEHVVNIGIGGSDLGPLMVCEALKPYQHPRIKMYFVSNIDGAQINTTLEHLCPQKTLFIITSKTFTTLETLTNARTAREWFLHRVKDETAIGKHFIAVSANPEQVAHFGMDPATMFEFWDWVGGRYSLCSAIGLPIAIAVGMDRFNELCAGAHAMDCHFQNTPLENNMPVLLALLGVWYHNFFAAETHAILPYDQRLHRFPAYLQQLDMESNGKSVNRDGQAISDYTTAPILWGEPGSNGQHAFFQLLHQGNRLIPADFLVAIQPQHSLDDHHRLLLANCFAQTEALMRGKTETEARGELRSQGLQADALEALLPHRVFSGNRPTNTLLFKQLDAHTLGTLIALYEHKIFVQAAIWNINAFDQWGVELGKALSKTIAAELTDDATITSHDSSTNGLMNYSMNHRKRRSR